MLRPALLIGAALVGGAAGHGSMVHPRPRQSIDYLAGVNTEHCSNLTGAKCENGQAAFYYSQGCFIGCPTCDHMSGRRQTDLCGNGKKATLNDPKLRTVNRNATAGSEEDIYRHNPWRSPGNAPVADVCGLAGGTPWGADAAEAGDYTNTTYAHHGTRGSTLPKMPTGTVWKIGGSATVSWNVRNNHGGGYSYRLCPATETLSENCFKKHPLDFDQTKQAILLPNGTRVPIPGTFTNVGTEPAGSWWAMLPIPENGLGPRCLPGPNDNEKTPFGCQPWEGRDSGHYNKRYPNGHVPGPCVRCPETPGSDCSRCDNGGANAHSPAFPSPYNGIAGAPVEGVLDVLKVPANLPPGEYVLGWRYDCEATAQVWSNCADITLAK